MAAPAISVIVVNYNRRALLERALESLFRQTLTPEIIVVDNGSTDGSPKCADHFPGIRWIQNDVNLGFCRANNQAIEVARGEFIALLNNDAQADPHWLETLVNCFRRPEVGMAASKILLHADPRVIDKAGHLIYPDGQVRGRGSGERDWGQFDREEEVLWPDGCAAMYRKTMLDEIGGFDEDFFAYVEDAELGIRARSAGWVCLFAPGAIVVHRRASTMGISSWRRIALIERNRTLMAAKHFPKRLLWLNLYYYGLRLVSGVAAAIRGQGESVLFPGIKGKSLLAWGLVCGDLGALCLLPRMLRKRAPCRQLRKLSSREIHELIMRNRISLRELSTRAAIP
jgi:GT2 family glycosyltransferase